MVAQLTVNQLVAGSNPAARAILVARLTHSGGGRFFCLGGRVMKKRVVERTLVALLACAVCVGVTSCGEDPAEQPAPQVTVPQASTPSVPATQPPPSEPAEPASVAPSSAGVVAPDASSPADVFAELERLGQLAQQPGADFLASARAWAGDTVKRKLWVCGIAQRAGRTADLVALTRDARAACSGTDATFGHFCAVARHFKASSAFDEAREALTQAIPLADTPERKAEVAALWRSLQ